MVQGVQMVGFRIGTTERGTVALWRQAKRRGWRSSKRQAGWADSVDGEVGGVELAWYTRRVDVLLGSGAMR